MHNQHAIFQWVFPNAFSRFLSVIMMALIMLLTNANYFLYPGSVENVTPVDLTETDGGHEIPAQGNPAGPDEKSPNAPVSFNEEYVHRQEDLHNPFWTNHLFQYMIQQSEKLDVIHFEILSPPPESIG